MKRYGEKELLLIWLDSFADFEYKNKVAIHRILAGKAEIKENIRKNRTAILSLVGEAGCGKMLASADGEYLKSVLGELERAGETAITLASENYPEQLKNIADPPLCLYAKGNVGLLNTKIFGIVGSRKSLPLSKAIAADFAKELTAAGFTLITGTAEGVDEQVLKAGIGSGAVIAVSAGGLNEIYPAANRELVEAVAKNGLVISENRENVKPMPYFFPVRNRIIAGLSVGALIVSGRIKSGTMYTADYCLDYGRDLFAVPYTPGTEAGEGTNYLIKNGATLCDSPKDILSFYGIEEKKSESEFSPFEKEIFSALKCGETHIEKIAERIGKQVFEISPVLALLEIKGVVVRTGSNTYGLIRNQEI